MAFYRDTQRKSRQEKRIVAENRAGFEDEGSRYGRAVDDRRGAAPAGGYGRPAPQGRKPYGDRPRTDKPYGAAPAGGSRPAPQGRKPYGDRPRADKPYGAAPAGGYDRPAPQGRKPYGDRPRADKPYGAAPAGGYDRPAPQGRKPYGDRSRGDKPYGDRPRAERPSFDHPRFGADRPRETPRGERPPMERAPHDRRPTGDYRFKGTPEKYSERGGHAAPRPYDEQRRDNQHGFAPAAERFRYAPSPSYAPPAPVVDEEELVPNENLLSGRNPIREALKSGRDIEKLLVQRGELSGSAREIIQMAKERHIPVQEVDRARLDAIATSHQGMLAFASAYQYSTVEDMLKLAEERGEKPFLVLLDGVTDPHNLGAIIRTAECAGAHGVIVQERRAVGLTPAAVKASAGAVEYVPVARVTNLVTTIEMLKKQGVWVYAADMTGDDYAAADLSGAVALVIGAEGEGVSRLALEKCDKALAIPLKGKLDSLNASVAAGVLIYAVMRAR